MTGEGGTLQARTLEPELMEDAEQARAYASADFASVNQGFVDRFRATFPELVAGKAADLGCGPADIPDRLRAALPRLRIAAIDASRAMLAQGRARISRDVLLAAARADRLPIRDASLDACLSNSLMHHLADASVAWREIRRVARPGAAVFVMDLARPATSAAARAIVDREAPNEPAVLRHDFYASLLAAFTPDEVRRDLEAARLAGCRCELVSDRHWLAWGRVP